MKDLLEAIKEQVAFSRAVIETSNSKDVIWWNKSIILVQSILLYNNQYIDKPMHDTDWPGEPYLSDARQRLNPDVR